MKLFKMVVILLSLLLSFQPMQAMATDSGADAAILSNAGNPKPKSDNINKPITASKSILKKHERLVLMPLRLTEDDKQLQGAMEAALVEGLQQQYEVFAGEIVSQKAREVFLKESRDNTKKYCDETRCMQNIAEAFQTEYIATVSVTKQKDGYFLALIIQNIFDNLVVYSNSVPCEKCDTYTVVSKLKELSTLVAKVNEADETETQSSFWGGIGLKYWMSSYNPAEGFGASSLADKSFNLAFGYERFFYTVTIVGIGGEVTNGDSYPASGIKLGEQSFGIGYNVNSNIAFVIGNKTFLESY